MAKPYHLVERTYEFSKSVVLFINAHQFQRLQYSVVDQLLRSATSIAANVIEGRSGNSRKNLLFFLSIALRSANETKYWLRLVGDTMDVRKSELVSLQKEADEISRILAKSIITLKKNTCVVTERNTFQY